MLYRIGAYLLDTEAYEVSRDGSLVPTEPQVFNLLVLLIENRHRAVGKDEIFEQVWKGRIVSDAALSSRIKGARRTLGDSGSTQTHIRTIHGRGFRFVGDVEVVDLPAMVGAPTGGNDQADTARPDPPLARANPVPAGAQIGQRAGAGLATKLPPSTRPMAIALACVAVVGASYLVSHVLNPPAGPGRGYSSVASPAHSVSIAQPSASTFRDCDVCPDMVELPLGEFMMGSPENERRRQQSEGPPRRVVIAKRFALGRLEVTVDQFEVFVAETGIP